MKVLVSKELWEITKKFDNSLNENGMLPVLDFSDLKNENICNSIKAALSEADKTVIVANSITHECYKALLSENPGLIIFTARPNSLKKLLENGLKTNNLILVGVREWNTEEMNFIKEKKIKTYPMKEIISEGIHEISDSIMSVAKDFTDLYISINLNVLDPCYAHGVNYSVAGGLSSRELLFFINRLKNLKSLKMADLCGFGSERENTTLSLAVKIIKELY